MIWLAWIRRILLTRHRKRLLSVCFLLERVRYGTEVNMCSLVSYNNNALNIIQHIILALEKQRKMCA